MEELICLTIDNPEADALGLSLYTPKENLQLFALIKQEISPKNLEKIVRSLNIVAPLFLEDFDSKEFQAKLINQKEYALIADLRNAPCYDVDFGANNEVIETFWLLLHSKSSSGQKPKIPVSNVLKDTVAARRLSAEEQEQKSVIRDIFGREREQKRKVQILSAGAGVVENEKNEFVATRSGYIDLASNNVNIIESYQIRSLADWMGGKKLKFVGNVEVGNNVIQNFDIAVSGDINIAGSTEGSNLIAKGNITVGEGLIGQGIANVESWGSVRARYVNQAKLFCAGNCDFIQGLHHSDLICHGRLSIRSGSIVGGKVYAGQGIKTQNLGGTGGVKTLVAVGYSSDFPLNPEDINQERLAVEEVVTELFEKLKTYMSTPAAIAALTQEEKRRVKLDMNKLKRLKIRLQTLTSWMKEHHPQKYEYARIAVNGTAFPGVTIRINNATYFVNEEMSKVAFFYDPSTGGVGNMPYKAT